MMIGRTTPVFFSLTGLSHVKYGIDLKQRLLVLVFCDLKHAPD